MEITKVLAIALIASAVYVLLKNNKPEFAPIVLTGVSAGIFIYALSAVLTEVFALREILSAMGLSGKYFLIAFKALGIVCITSFAADICRDSGSASLENKVNFAGRCAVFITVFPLIQSIAETVSGVLK